MTLNNEFKARVFTEAVRINDSYGRGQVVSIAWPDRATYFPDGLITKARIELQFGFENRRITINPDGKIRFCGKVRIVGRPHSEPYCDACGRHVEIGGYHNGNVKII